MLKRERGVHQIECRYILPDDCWKLQRVVAWLPNLNKAALFSRRQNRVIA